MQGGTSYPPRGGGIRLARSSGPQSRGSGYRIGGPYCARAGLHNSNNTINVRIVSSLSCKPTNGPSIGCQPSESITLRLTNQYIELRWIVPMNEVKRYS